MKVLVLASVLGIIIVAGCDPAPSPSVSTTTPAKTPEATPPTETKDAKTETAPAPEAQVKQPKGFNSSRINQLYDLKTTTVTIGSHAFHSWVMDDESKRQEGMMFLKDSDYKDDQGMLFVFSDAQPRSFWMQNTLIDLDIAYIDTKGNIVSIHTMKRLDETGVPSGGDAMYALEAKPGIFKKLGIRAGMVAKIDPSVKAKD